MKRLAGLVAGVLILGGIGATKAADVYSGTTLNVPHPSSPDRTLRDGFYLNGSLGVAFINRDIRRTIGREVGVDANIPESSAQEDIDAFIKTLDEHGVSHGGNSVPGGNITFPLIGDKLSLRGEDDITSPVLGVEALYLWRLPANRWGVSLGAGVSFYTDGESSLKHAGAAGRYSGGTAASGDGPDYTCEPALCAGDPSDFSQSGVVTVERDLDIDLIGRLHYFASEQLAFNVGAGVSFARVSLSGRNVDDGGAWPEALDTRFDDDDWAVGLVLTAGADYWLTDRVTIGAAYTYKHHEFDAGGSSSASLPLEDLGSLYGKSSDNASAEDDVHTIKLKLGVKLD